MTSTTDPEPYRSCTMPVSYARHLADAHFHLAQARGALQRAQRQAKRAERQELAHALALVARLQAFAREGAHQAGRAERRRAA